MRSNISANATELPFFREVHMVFFSAVLQGRQHLCLPFWLFMDKGHLQRESSNTEKFASQEQTIFFESRSQKRLVATNIQLLPLQFLKHLRQLPDLEGYSFPQLLHMPCRTSHYIFIKSVSSVFAAFIGMCSIFFEGGNTIKIVFVSPVKRSIPLKKSVCLLASWFFPLIEDLF